MVWISEEKRLIDEEFQPDGDNIGVSPEPTTGCVFCRSIFASP
jgi:hypothetical protein